MKEIVENQTKHNYLIHPLRNGGYCKETVFKPYNYRFWGKILHIFLPLGVLIQ